MTNPYPSNWGSSARWLLALGLAVSSCSSSDAPSSASTPPPPAAVCGDGVAQAGEECDDGNASNDDGCLQVCQRPASFVSGDIHLHSQGCNDEVVSPGELVSLIATEGIRVGSVLVWGVGYEQDRPLLTGGDYPES